MYKNFSANDYKKHMSLPIDYTVDGFIAYGTFHPGPYDDLKKVLVNLGIEADFSQILTGPYFDPILEFVVNKKRYWFAIAYGGAMLSEWAHLACLFGSKINIVIGNCGGLLKGAKTPEVIIPTYSYGDESTTRMYERNGNKHFTNSELSNMLVSLISPKHKVWRGPTMTCQAMLAETLEIIQQWSEDGYYGVEMESSTVLAVSNHFGVKASAMFVIADNLVEEKSVLDDEYQNSHEVRLNVRNDLITAALHALLKN